MMSASMFGAFSLDLPTGLKTRLADMGGVGVRGAFVLGMVSALIAAPCTGPVLGALLTWISSSRDVALGALGLFAYALGLGLLFWVVGTFAIALPKSGRWLAWVKSVFGVVLLSAAFYYVRPLLPWLSLLPSLGVEALLATGGVLLVSGLALGAIHLSFEYTERRERVQKSVGVALMVAGVLTCARALESPSHEGLVWREDFEQAEQEARASRRPMLVDFSASWCGACGELDRHTFSHPEVVREGQRFVTVRIDLSPGKDNAEKRQYLQRHAQRGLPLVVLHRADGKEASRVTGFLEPDEFASLLRRVD
jgi:thiol:disulfide interchange protein DsbD